MNGAQIIIESMNLQNEWYEKCKTIKSNNALTNFMKHILNNYDHDYGTAVHATAACALAAAWVACEKLELSGFQASCVMWEFIKHWTKTGNKCGLRLVDYDDMLYPQYEEKFDKTIRRSIFEEIQKEARRLLEEDEKHLKEGWGACGSVRAHWKKIADGEVPFGYRISDE